MSHDHDSRIRFTRRELLIAGAGSAALLGLGPLAGRSARAAEPKSGGRLRVGIGAGSTTDTLDPATFTDNYMQFVGFGGMRNCLTEINAARELVGELAEGWEASPDAKVWTFTLRSDVEFHNGKTLDAEDVVASFNHHRGEDSTSTVKTLLDSVVDIRADGPDTVVFELAAGNADWPYIVSDYHFGIMPADDEGGVDARSGIGTGGYVIQQYEPGVRSLLSRNPNYWKAGHAHFDEVEVLSIVDVAARTNALSTGEIHLMDRCDLKTVHLLQRNRNVQIVEVTGSQHFTAPMHTDRAPFDNNDVRLALKYAVDREDLVQKILRGHGKPGNDSPITPATAYYAELEQRSYDPERARYHLKQAGLESLQVDLSAADAAFAGAVDAAVLYKEHAAAAGININVVREPNDGYWSNVWLKKPWCMCYWGGRATADWMFSTGYAADAAWNDTNWKHERFNELLLAARAELDQERRQAMYTEMQRLVRDEGGTAVLMLANYVGAHSTDLAHPEQLGNNMDMDGMKAIERWWFT